MKRSIISILKKKNLADKEELEKALDIEKKSGVPVAQILLKKGIIQEEDFLDVLGEQHHLKTINKPEPYGIEDIIPFIPLKFVQKYRIVPYKKTENKIEIALSDPTQLHPMDELRMMLQGYETEFLLAPEAEVIKLIHTLFEGKNEKTGINEVEDLDSGFEFLDELHDLRDSMDLANEAPIIRIVNMILSNAVTDRASDIHIEPQEKEVTVRYRVDGILHKVLSPPKSIQSGIISRIKIMGNMNIAENRLPQDGRIKIRFGGKDIDIRVSSLPTQFGERLVLRLLNKSEYNFSIDSIGFEKPILAQYQKLVREPNGIILITGPTGSGKTTTLYASLMEVKDEGNNIITVEDPVEYQISGISQVQAKPKIGLSFAEGLRTILRQDPDIIMVGEIRDEETARVAVQSSLTGHLVFSTLHTNDAPTAINRLLDMGIEPFLITATVRGIMAQRLLRVLCPECKKKVTLSAAHKKLIETHLATTQTTRKKGSGKKQASAHIYEATGCKACLESGYKGRTGIYELLVISENLRTKIVSDATVDQIRKIAIEEGMKTLRQAAIEKVLAGETTLEEALRIT